MAVLNKRIRDFYDASTPLWLDTWGEQMHHGYYGPDGNRRVEHRRAQIDMIEALLEWGMAPKSVDRFLDAGCGVGGSSRYLAMRYPDSQGLGVTLSPVQASEGNGFSTRAGLENRVKLRAQDVYDLDPAEDGTFDLIWSMESAEHMADKAELMRLFRRLLRPGGVLLMATWCHRPEPPMLTFEDQRTLRKIQDLYHLPPLVSIPVLEQRAREAGFSAVRSDDWSDAVAPFWDGVIKSGLDPRNWPGLLRAGLSTVKGAYAMRFMKKGFAEGTIRYGVLCATNRPR